MNFIGKSQEFLAFEAVLCRLSQVVLKICLVYYANIVFNYRRYRAAAGKSH